MNLAILEAEVQQFIQDNLNTDLAKLLFKKSPFQNISTKEIAEQIAGKKVAEKKLPTWFNTPGIYFPAKLALEQSSSEITAQYKSKILKADQIIDLTGGMGVDAYYFAKQAKQVIHIEQQAELSAIAMHNAQVLGAQNIRFVVDSAQHFLNNSSESWDMVYIDPSRRVATQKVFKLSDCEPNIVALQDELLERSPLVMVKTAPLLDIKSGLSELKQVREIQVISVNNEMKELLWILDRNFKDPEPLIKCVSLNKGMEQHFDFKWSEERAFKISAFSQAKTYVYEPDVAWLKAGCFKMITQKYALEKLHEHTHLYTSDKIISDFPGRTFQLNYNWSYKEFIKSLPLKKANIITRNFPLSAPELQKKHKIQDGGKDYLLFCTDLNNELRVIQAQRI